MGHRAVVLVVLFILSPCNPSKIIDRFRGSYPQNKACAAKFNAVFTVKTIDIISQYNYRYVIILNKINCTFIYSSDSDPGQPDDHGNYSGIIGQIQRNEFQFGMALVRPDSLPFEPGLISPVIMPADSIVLSHRNDSHRSYETNLANFVNHIHIVFYSNFLLCSIILVIVFTWIVVAFEREKECDLLDPWKDTWTEFSNAIISCINNVLKQGSLSCCSKEGNILSIIYGFFIFLSIHNLLLAKMGADLVVVKHPPRIDSIKYFIDKENVDIMPVILKKLALYDMLKSASIHRPESEMGCLWKVLQEKGAEKSIFDGDMDESIITLNGFGKAS